MHVMPVGGGAAADPSVAYLASLGNTANLEFAHLPGYAISVDVSSAPVMRNAVAAPASGVSRSAYDILLGDTSATPPAGLPTYTGTPGDASSAEYYSFDGSDVLHMPGANTAFIDSIAKDNATFSLILAIYVVAGSSNQIPFGTCTGAFRRGLAMNITDAEVLAPQIMNDGGVAVQHSSTLGALTGGAWHIIGISIDEAAGSGGGHIIQDGSTESFTSTYTTPSTSGFGIPTIGGQNGSTSLSPVNNNTRIGDLIMWNTAIGSSGLTTASAVLEAKYGV